MISSLPSSRARSRIERVPAHRASWHSRLFRATASPPRVCCWRRQWQAASSSRFAGLASHARGIGRRACRVPAFHRRSPSPAHPCRRQRQQTGRATGFLEETNHVALAVILGPADRRCVMIRVTRHCVGSMLKQQLAMSIWPCNAASCSGVRDVMRLTSKPRDSISAAWTSWFSPRSLHAGSPDGPPACAKTSVPSPADQTPWRPSHFPRQSPARGDRHRPSSSTVAPSDADYDPARSDAPPSTAHWWWVSIHGPRLSSAPCST